MKPEPDTYKLRKMTDEELCHWIAGWNDRSGIGKRLLGEAELHRRLRRPEALRSWIAIGISLLALLCSLALRFA